MKTRAFTLIELLIVLVIIGILASLAVPQYRLFVIRARGAEAMQNVRAIADSLWRYYLEAGDFPRTEYGPIIVPSVLDIKVTNPSKYFTYGYALGERCPHADNAVVINAEFNFEVEYPDGRVPEGVPLRYYIVYCYGLPSLESGGQIYTGQKMDEHWYKYYWYDIAIKETPGYRPIVYWPGSGE